MRALLVLAAVALLHLAGPADAIAKPVSKARCAAAKAAAERVSKAPRRSAARRRATARRRALLRRCNAARRPLVGESGGALIGMPGALAAPIPFATPQPAAPGPAAPGPAPTPAPEPPVLPPIYSNPYAVQVQAFEFGLQLSKAAVSAGDVRVEFNLARAGDPHNLWLVRDDGTGSAHLFEEEPSGAVVAKLLPLTRGRWKLFCSLSGHEAAGMRTTLTVD